VKRVTDLYREKAETYDSEDWDKELSAIGKMILSEIPFHGQMHVMDFGAGTGLLCSHIAPMVQKITAVDISRAMLEKLNAKPELTTKVDVVCQNIMNTPIDVKFDMIISAFALHHVEDTNKLIQTFAEHLGAGSRIALVDVDEEDGSFHSEDNSGVFHCGFNRDNLKTILKIHSFEQIDFVRTHFFKWNEKEYSAFLVTALKV
jgi:2-polyprenyl-3-methyl-5-hydroxy-6-metoxy-1,4-benzoquinol methylase